MRCKTNQSSSADVKMASDKEGFQADDNADMRRSSTDDEHDDIIPDGGWGWVVCFGSFMINFILDGTMFSFGVIMLELLDYFGESKSKTAWVGSTLLGMSMMMGPLVSFLLRRFSCRQVTIFGTLLSTIGFVASMFAPNVETLIVTYGVIGGIGFSMVFLPAIIIVGLYFNKKRAIATGIATSGSGMGVFAYGYICDRLLNAFNWRGTVLILSGLVLNCVICGFLFRPVVEEKLRKRFREMANSDGTASSGYGGSSEETDAKTKENIYECLRPLLNKTLHPRSNILLSPYPLQRRISQSAENIRHLTIPHPAVPHRLHSSSHNITSMKPDLAALETTRIKRGLSKPILRKDIFYSGSIRHIPDFQHCKTLSQFLAEMTRPDSEDDSSSIDESCRLQKGWWSRLKLTLGTHLFKKPIFVLLLITFTMWTVQSVPLTYIPDYAVSRGIERSEAALLISIFLLYYVTVQSVPLTYIPDYAVSRGIERSEAALLISIVGITNTLGRIFAGFITDMFNVRSIVIYIFALITASAVNFAITFCHTFAPIAVCAAVFGLCMAVAVSMRTIVLADNLGIEHLTSSFGMVAMFQGITFTIFPPIAGTLYDVTGSFFSPFMMAGAIYIVSCACSAIVYLMNRRMSARGIIIAQEEIVIEEINPDGSVAASLSSVP